MNAYSHNQALLSIESTESAYLPIGVRSGQPDRAI